MGQEMRGERCGASGGGMGDSEGTRRGTRRGLAGDFRGTRAAFGGLAQKTEHALVFQGESLETTPGSYNIKRG